MHGLSQKSNVKQMIWGDDNEFKALESQNKICSALTDAEKSLETTVNSAARKEIAEVT